MGRSAKQKGNRGEREFAELTGGHRVPLSGAVDGYEGDVILPNGWMAEVKRRKSGLKTLYDWVLNEREEPDVVAFRADRMPWIVTMELDKFMYLLECERKLKELEENDGE